MIGRFLETLTDEQLQRVADGKPATWVYGTFGALDCRDPYDSDTACLLTHVYGDADIVRMIQDRARRILAGRALSRMDGPREAVGADNASS
jgi:hypothetical protein